MPRRSRWGLGITRARGQSGHKAVLPGASPVAKSQRWSLGTSLRSGGWGGGAPGAARQGRGSLSFGVSGSCGLEAL